MLLFTEKSDTSYQLKQEGKNDNFKEVWDGSEIFLLPHLTNLLMAGVLRFILDFLISDEKISVSFLIAILILLAVCKCFS